MKSVTKQAQPINYGLISIFFVIIYLVVQMGFYKTYLRFFPDFKGFELLHHIHGMLMSSWLLMLIAQPLLIRSGRYKVHRLLGKISYVLAPLVWISMCLIVRLSYHKGMASVAPRDLIASLALNIPQLFYFPLFYILAIVHKNDTNKHMRYMIGTALIMITAGLGRVLIVDFKIDVILALYITLTIEAGIAAAFFLFDVIKKKDYLPNLIIMSTFICAVLIYYARHTDAWQAFGQFFVTTFY
jgi:hypothetical protein